MNDPKTGSNDGANCITKNTMRLGYWTFAWVASMAVTAFGPKLAWDYATLPTIIAVLVNVGVGFGMIEANRRHLRGMDELQRKIFLDASALTLGVGLVCGLSYGLLEDIRLISFEPEIAHVVILMCLTFMLGVFGGHRRYR